MSQTAESPSTTTPASNNGRDKNGRFTVGNPGGPGNPFGRRAAAMRQAALAAVSPEKMYQLFGQLTDEALQGNLDSRKLLLKYVLGSEPKPVNPDTLDHEETQQYLKNVELHDFNNRVPMVMPADMSARYCRGYDARMQEMNRQEQAKNERWWAREQRRAAEKKAKRKRQRQAKRAAQRC